jgi:hypothetical protein
VGCLGVLARPSFVLAFRGCLTVAERGEVARPKPRTARAAASRRVQGFRHDLAAILSEGLGWLASETDSETWFVLGERLGRACERLGSATYDLREWEEPSDDIADVDDGPRRGRRNTRSWDR